MKNRIKLIFENNIYYFDNYSDILKILLKLDYSFKKYYKNNRYYLEVYKNKNLIYSTSINYLANYNAYDYLISAFLNSNCDNPYVLNDFSLFDYYSGEIIENKESEKEYNNQIKILKNNYFLILNKQIIFFKIGDYVKILTKKGDFFNAVFCNYIYNYNEKIFVFSHSGIRNKKRYIRLSEREINTLYTSIYNFDTNYIIDYSTYLIYKFNLSYNLMKNSKRILELEDIK